ncbi:MAG: hypothetical protein QOH67_4030, partial [Hyphomicrobiales bacterium]|nr:hypothetical protein [Hyphomicrobiales bacterium]
TRCNHENSCEISTARRLRGNRFPVSVHFLGASSGPAQRHAENRQGGDDARVDAREQWFLRLLARHPGAAEHQPARRHFRNTRQQCHAAKRDPLVRSRQQCDRGNAIPEHRCQRRDGNRQVRRRACRAGLQSEELPFAKPLRKWCLHGAGLYSDQLPPAEPVRGRCLRHAPSAARLRSGLHRPDAVHKRRVQDPGLGRFIGSTLSRSRERGQKSLPRADPAISCQAFVLEGSKACKSKPSIFSIWRCPTSPTRPTAARTRCWCASRPAGTPDGASARRRRCPRSRRSSARSRTVCAARFRTRCSASRCAIKPTLRASRRTSRTTRWTCCRRRIRFRESRWRCGTCSARLAVSRCGGCSAIGAVIPRLPTPRSYSATLRRRRLRVRKRCARGISLRRSSAGSDRSRRCTAGRGAFCRRPRRARR